MKTAVVIPSKNRVESLTALIGQLREQDPEQAIYLMNNGYRHMQIAHLDVQVHDCDGLGIHGMWNTGWSEAQAAGFEAVCFLNDDLTIGERFIEHLTRPFDNLDTQIVSANYDGREIEEPTEIHSICAGRYDGTGGLAGFAFAVRADLEYRFPNWLKWYSGDSHLTVMAEINGWRMEMAPHATVDHDKDMSIWSTRPYYDVTREDQHLFAIWYEGVEAAVRGLVPSR